MDPSTLPSQGGGMAAAAPLHITTALNHWRSGQAKQDELNGLLEQISPELKCIAARILRGSGRDHLLLQTTELLHEFVLRVSDRQTDWVNRRQFYAIAAQIMRWIVVDLARREWGRKSPGDVSRHPQRSFVPFEDQDPTLQAMAQRAGLPSAGLRIKDENILTVDEGLTALAELDPRKACILEQYYFGGLYVEEIADVLQLSRTTVNRELALAKAFLRHFLEDRERCQLRKKEGTP